MQEAVPVGKGAMAAIIGLDMDLIKEKIVEVEGIVNIANWNSSSQIVISGEKSAVENAIKILDAPKSVMLPVSAPFHSELMLPAEEKLSVDLNNINFRDLQFPIINNVDVEEITDKDKVRDGLRRQVSRPVLWHSTALKMLNDKGMEKYAEVGAGKVLGGLIRRTSRDLDKKIELVNFQTFEDLNNG